MIFDEIRQDMKNGVFMTFLRQAGSSMLAI